MTSYLLTLTDPEVAYLLSVVQEQPLKDCYALFSKIRGQVQRQQKGRGNDEDSGGDTREE